MKLLEIIAGNNGGKYHFFEKKKIFLANIPHKAFQNRVFYVIKIPICIAAAKVLQNWVFHNRVFTVLSCWVSLVPFEGSFRKILLQANLYWSTGSSIKISGWSEVRFSVFVFWRLNRKKKSAGKRTGSFAQMLIWKLLKSTDIPIECNLQTSLKNNCFDLANTICEVKNWEVEPSKFNHIQYPTFQPQIRVWNWYMCVTQGNLTRLAQ